MRKLILRSSKCFPVLRLRSTVRKLQQSDIAIHTRRLQAGSVIRWALLFFMATLGWFGPFAAKAKFAVSQTRLVPVERLFTNLQQRLARDTNDFEVTYDLARLHSMAYSTPNFVILNVRADTDRPQFYSPWEDSGVPTAVSLSPSSKLRAQALRHLTNAILLYERAIVLLKKSTNDTAYKEWLVLPLELGHAWCLDQAGRRNDALAGYRKALAVAWKEEVTGEFKLKEWVEDKWEAVKAGTSPFRGPARRGYIGPGVCFSEEIIGYMLKLLEPANDAKEIAELKDRQKTLKSVGRAITPILVPLTKATALEELVNPNAAVTFDLDGSGLPRQWGWITPKAAWLVFDPSGQGQITSALQMFGNVTFWIFWRDGYAALRSLDDDHDGALRGPELRGIALWQDLNGNGVSDPGEVRSVAEWGITTISCRGEPHSTGVSWCLNGVTFANGETRPTYDWVAPSPSHAE